MPYCINCGQQLADGAKFCAGCGTAVNGTNQSTQRKAVYDGEIHKCPNCGEVLNSFVSNCPACGYELRGAKNSNAVQEFAQKLEQIENSRNINGNAFLGLKNKINKFGGVDSVDEQKISLIRNFTIPNTKEDVYEFMILAASNIDLKLYGMAYHSSQFQGMLVASQRTVSDAWFAKFEQAYQKAQLLFTDGQELLNINELYEQKMKEMRKKKREFPLFIIGSIGILILIPLIVWIPLFLTGAFEFDSKKDYGIEMESIHLEEGVKNDFVDGYEKADYSKFNSLASENGLEGTEIYIEGVLQKTEVLEADDTQTIIGYVTDTEDNEWLILMHVVPIVTESHYDGAIKKNVILTAKYDGYSKAYKMPTATLNELLIVENETILNGMQKVLDQ